MKKIVTAMGHKNLNQELTKLNRYEIPEDIPYQEAVLEQKEIDYLIVSDSLPGENTFNEFINKIKSKIIVIIENKENEAFLKEKNISYFYKNKFSINDLTYLIEKDTSSLEEEIRTLKELLLNKKEKKIDFIKIIEKIKALKPRKVSDNLIIENKVLSILGSGGIGKSVFATNLANSLENLKILIIDFDILNNSIHTIFGVKKYPKKLNKNKFDVKDLIIKINNKINLICGVDLLFNNKYEIDKNTIKNMLNKLKKQYDLIIIDTSSECFFDYTKCLIENSDASILLVEGNLIEIAKSKRWLEIYLNEWNVEKEKINIVFNKYNKNAIDEGILKEIFGDFNILGKIKFIQKFILIRNKCYEKITKNVFEERKQKYGTRINVTK